MSVGVLSPAALLRLQEAPIIEVYTGQVVSVFDGSLMEWSLDPALPVHQSVASDLC